MALRAGEQSLEMLQADNDGLLTATTTDQVPPPTLFLCTLPAFEHHLISYRFMLLAVHAHTPGCPH